MAHSKCHLSHRGFRFHFTCIDLSVKDMEIDSANRFCKKTLITLCFIDERFQPEITCLASCMISHGHLDATGLVKVKCKDRFDQGQCTSIFVQPSTDQLFFIGE